MKILGLTPKEHVQVVRLVKTVNTDHPGLCKYVDFLQIPRWMKRAYNSLTRKRFITTKNKSLCHHFFNSWLYFHGKDTVENEIHQVCDHLGPIDTLGHQRSIGKFTESYSCEAYCQFWLHIGPFSITYINDSNVYVMAGMRKSL